MDPSRKRKRPVISCTECHRRKQKCDRQQPCSQCTKRGLQDCCYYEWSNERAFDSDRHPNVQGDALNSDAAGSLCSSNANTNMETMTISPWSPSGSSRVTSHMGYTAFTGTNAILGGIEGEFEGQPAKALPDPPPVSDVGSRYKTLVRQLPPKAHTQTLVRFFFSNIAWKYSIVDEDTFWDLVATWERVPYASRSRPHELDPAVRYFPALLFQVLAQAALFQPTTHESFLEELKQAPDMSLADLATEFSDAGHQLLSLFGASDSALVKVQAGLQRACFLKTTGSVVEAWHVIGGAIRDAQELGLHHPSAGARVPTCDQTWLVLHLWDAHMAVVLGRPMATRLDPSTVPFPRSCTGADITPFDMILCGYHAAYKHLQDIHQLEPAKPGMLTTVDRLHDAIQFGLANMPAWANSAQYALSSSWLPAARETLVTEINFTILALHRPFIFAHARNRVECLRASLRILQSQRRLFDAADPGVYPAFDMVFATFDAVVIVAATYIMYPDENLEHFQESHQAIEWALERLDAMRVRSTLAASAYVTVKDVFDKLVARTSPQTQSTQMSDGPMAAPQVYDGMDPLLGFDGVLPPSPLHDLIFGDLTPSTSLPGDETAANDFWRFIDNLVKE